MLSLPECPGSACPSQILLCIMTFLQEPLFYSSISPSGSKPPEVRQNLFVDFQRTMDWTAINPQSKYICKDQVGFNEANTAGLVLVSNVNVSYLSSMEGELSGLWIFLQLIDGWIFIACKMRLSTVEANFTRCWESAPQQSWQQWPEGCHQHPPLLPWLPCLLASLALGAQHPLQLLMQATKKRLGCSSSCETVAEKDGGFPLPVLGDIRIFGTMLS
ncbi:uncharacterized protein [Heliangelus exortis]|uniref:uncharacterized protein n=1 Tax=Heliangelus exortis TaxID=472823 RepID=UPI003A8D9C11